MKKGLCILVCLGHLVLIFTMPHKIQGVDNTIEWDINNQIRWPHLYALELEKEKAINDPELSEIRDSENISLSLLRLPFITDTLFIESYSLYSTENLPEEGNVFKNTADMCRNAYRENYYQRFPMKEKSSFDEAMQPFEDYWKDIAQNLDSTDHNDMDEDKSKDRFESAWTLLDQALSR